MLFISVIKAEFSAFSLQSHMIFRNHYNILLNKDLLLSVKNSCAAFVETDIFPVEQHLIVFFYSIINVSSLTLMHLAE